MHYLCSQKQYKLADNQLMEYISVIKFADKYGISERTVRNYCANGKIDSVGQGCGQDIL